MRVLLIITLLALVIRARSESLLSSSVSSLVNRPLPEVQAAIAAYYNGQSRTNSAWGRDSASTTNAAGEVGIRFRICTCTSIPVCFEVQATSVSSNSTHLAVGPCSEFAESRDEFREVHLRRSRRILTGVMDALESKP